MPLALALHGQAFALSTDRDQPLDVRAQTNSSTFGTANVSVFTGNVRMIQGSLKAGGDEARISEIEVAGADGNGRRLVLTGAPATLEQLMDGGGKVTARASTIDYRSDTGIAELTGDVIVVQEGRSEFRGPRMTYNTNTGAMEGGSQAAGSEVHMTFKPKPRVAEKKPADSKP
ncbi:lipopolysaccharide transport periplasmic protein LptA [Dokdonella sp.]|uniref:lipopolysaccharide transport periplasmic protein LptA n=1 Tax=Dokdonella sp. TaxID=2291710 RepID=UPI003C51E634